MYNLIPMYAFTFSLAFLIREKFFPEFALPKTRRTFSETIVEQIVGPCSGVDNHLKNWYNIVTAQPTTPTHQIEWRILGAICRYFKGAGGSQMKEIVEEVYGAYLNLLAGNVNSAPSSNNRNN